MKEYSERNVLRVSRLAIVELDFLASLDGKLVVHEGDAITYARPECAQFMIESVDRSSGCGGIAAVIDRASVLASSTSFLRLTVRRARALVVLLVQANGLDVREACIASVRGGRRDGNVFGSGHRVE